MRRLAAAAAALAAAGGALVLGCAVLQARPDFPARAEIYAAPVEIAPGALNGLRLRGAVEITSNHPAVGGISGLLIEDGEMIALTDHAWLIRSPLADDDSGGLRPVGIEVFPLRDSEGHRLDDAGKDAEGLARIADGLGVSFERDHRVEIVEGDRLVRTLQDRRFEALRYNKGLEALATLPDGQLLAIAEEASTGGYPTFLIDRAGTVRAARMPLPGTLPVTGADVGPDGRLYLLRRDFSLIAGFSIAIERYRLAPDGLPMPETREELATFRRGSGIDNMEAIALWQDAAGRTRLAIVSDDNFQFLQRTLLIDFEVLD